jgi:uncharacterized protein (UPF0276 family)
LKVNGNYPVESYGKMVAAGVPLAIENMDVGKDSGFDLFELARILLKTGCKIVLDAQHAYEQDHHMFYAKDLLDMFERHLAHLHVSGETETNNHSLVHKAKNAKKIVEFVGKVLSVKRVPIILEGEYGTSEDIRLEIEFLTSELGL